MNRFFYMSIAATNIKKNGKFYFSYLMTIIGTAAMFYIMCFIAFNDGLGSMAGSRTLGSILGMGCIVIGIFAVVFLLYTNSFLMKRRKKELGLYNILGMEKRHIARMMLNETLIMSFVGIIGGIISGILLSKLVLMLLLKLINFNVTIAFEISAVGVVATAILFGAIFLFTLITNLAKVHLSNPIELIRGSNVGEKEPKTKLLMALVGVICIGVGYYIAITTKSPLSAFSLFFIAVILVIIGTYCLFTAGSIAILKLLRKNKKYYYQTKHFISISGMLYRMKQNAVGLANICILSTMVLVMVSGTVCLYVGMEDLMSYRYPYDTNLSYKYTTKSDINIDDIKARVNDTVQKQGLKVERMYDCRYLSFSAGKKDSKFISDTQNHVSSSNINVLCIMTADEYKRVTGNEAVLSGNEVLSYSPTDKLDDSFELFSDTYTLKRELSEFPEIGEYTAELAKLHYIVVANDDVINRIYEKQRVAYGKFASEFKYDLSFDTNGSDEEKIACYNAVREAANVEISSTYIDEDGNEQVETSSQLGSSNKQENIMDFYSLYGGLLFLGIFLGLLFIMATVLIIYYKQISEGYDDKARFEIMQKVGMSRSEIKKSIHSQVLTVFFLPLVVAVIHVLASFNMISKLLLLLNLANTTLFVICTIATVLVFAVIYGLVYAVTAKVYYSIVE